MIVVPRCWRICLLVRLIMPWRLLAWVEITLPVPVSRKRFLTPDLVFILGIRLVSLRNPAGIGHGTNPRFVPVRSAACDRMGASSEGIVAATAVRWRAEGRRYGRSAPPWQLAGPERSPSAQILSRRQHHDHLPALELGRLLDLGQTHHIVAHAVQQLGAELLMRHFAAAEPQRHLDLVAFLEEAPDGPHLHVVIVIVDHLPELDFLDLDDFLLLARLGSLLLLLVLELAVVENLAHRRGHVGSDLDEVERSLLGGLECRLDRNNSAVYSVLIDQLHLADANFL